MMTWRSSHSRSQTGSHTYHSLSDSSDLLVLTAIPEHYFDEPYSPYDEAYQPTPTTANTHISRKERKTNGETDHFGLCSQDIIVIFQGATTCMSLIKKHSNLSISIKNQAEI